MKRRIPSIVGIFLGFVAAVLLACGDESTSPDPLTFPIEMVAIPGGTFLMGSPDYEPVHSVTISSFYMSKHEVAQAQYAQFDSRHESWFDLGDSLPVEMVSWYDAARFCNWLSEHEGYTKFYDDNDLDNEFDDIRISWNANGYRLPTEAEWEYACRAGTTTEYYWGDSINGDYCWYLDNSGHRPHEIGTKLPNSLGLHDMSGNVFEWCNDWAGPYSSEPQIDPIGPATGFVRISRGGYFDFDICSSAARTSWSPDYSNLGIGFRLAKNG